MGNLERQQQISAMQLGILLVIATAGIQVVISDRILIEKTGAGIWVAIILGGAIFWLISCAIVKLCSYYPGLTLVEYMQEIWGRPFGSLILLCLAFQLVLQIWAGLQGHVQRVTFFMFDRTPPEFIALALVILITYGALQDMGTLMRFIQFMFMVSLPCLAFIYLTNFLDVRVNNLLPLLAPDWDKIPAGVIPVFNLYKGCEVLLLFLPFMNKGRTNVIKILGLSFGYMVILYLTGFVLMIGVMGIEGVSGFSYPMTSLCKAIEIPGTFIERLEVYFILAWVPLVFANLAVLMNVISHIAAGLFAYQDHRPLVLGLAPLVYLGGAVYVGPNTYFFLDQIAAVLGTLILFFVVPVSFYRTWRKRRNCTC